MTTLDPTTVVDRLTPLWTEVLGIESAEPDDNFFALGGQSLSATRLLGRIQQELGVSLRLRDVFDHPTARGLAEHMAGIGAGAPPIRRIRRPSRNARPYDVPLTPAQEGVWHVQRMLADIAPFNQIVQVDAIGEIDLDLLLVALRAVVGTHDVLRTTFHDRDGMPVQTVHPEVDLPVERGTVVTANAQERERAVRGVTRSATRAPFDLTAEIPIRVHALTFGPTDHVLVITTHHIAFDGWSHQLLVTELAQAYRMLAGGEQVPVRPGIRYSDYVAWQHERITNGSLAPVVAHWRALLAPPYASLRLPGAIGDGSMLSLTTASPVVLSTEATAKVTATARAAGVTPFTQLLATFMAVLAARSGSDEARVAVKVANREQADTHGLIGQFDNTVIIRVLYSAELSPAELLGRVHAATLDAYRHQDVPFEYVLDQLRGEDGFDVGALMRVGFALHSRNLADLPVPGGTLRHQPGGRTKSGGKQVDPTTFDLVLELWPVADRIEGSVTYKTDVYSEETIQSFVAAYAAALSQDGGTGG